MAASAAAATIDRRALVDRHRPVLRAFDPESPLSVGNGELAFTADATGLQTFAEAYDETIPLGTLSQWAWHIAPNPSGWTIERFGFTEFDANGRKVGYADIPGDRRTPEIDWLRANPHRLHLGRIGFRLTQADGREATRDDLTDIKQTLDLWDGSLRSRFRLDGEPVTVETVCHPRLDLVAVRVVSPLVRRGRIAIHLRFPYGTGGATAADWTQPEAHETALVRSTREARSSSAASTTTSTTRGSPGTTAAVSRRRRGTPSSSIVRGERGLRGRGRLLSRPARGAAPLASRRRAGPRGSTGTASGRPAGPSTSPGAATRGGASWSGGSSSRSTSPPSSAPAGTRRRRPA